MAFDLIARLKLKDEFSAKMRRARTEMDKSAKAGESLTGGIRKLGGVVAGIGAAVGLGAMTKSIIETGSAFDSSMSNVQAMTGATSEEMKKLREQSKELGRETMFSAGEAAEAQAFLGMAGMETNEIMSSMPGLLDLAAAGQLELGRAADIATNVMSGFNMEADDMGHISNVLAKAASSANTSVEQMGGGMSYVAPIASAMGLSLEEVAAGIGIMSDAGIQGERAGTALRGAISSLSNPSSKLTKKLNAAGLSANDVSPKMNSLSDIIDNLTKAGFESSDALELVGETAGPGLAAMMTAGTDKLDEFTEELINSKDAAKNMAEIMQDNLGGDWTELQSAIEGLKIDAFEKMEPYLRMAINYLTEFVRKVPELAKSFRDYIEPALPTIQKLAIGFGVAIGVLGAIAGIIGILKGVALAAAFLTSPFGLAIVAITGIAVAFQDAYEKSEEFRNKIDGVVESIKGIFTSNDGGTDLLEMLGFSEGQIEVISNFIEDIQGRFDGFKDNMLEKFEALQPGIQLFMQTFEVVREVITDIFITILGIVSPILTGLGVAFGILADIAIIVFNNIIAPLIKLIWTTFQMLWNIVGPILTIFGAAIGVAFEVLRLVWEAIVKPFVTFLTGAFAVAIEFATGIIGTIGGAFDSLGDRISGVVDWLKSVADWFKNIEVPDWVSSIGGKVGGAVSAVGDFFTGGKGHYHGLDYVPKDDYQARLHKGERVLTAEENKEYSSGGSISINKLADYFVVREEADIARIAEELYRKLYEAKEAGAF